MAVEEGWELPGVWHGYSQYAYETLPLRTKYLSAADVLAFRDAAFLEYFGNGNYLEKISRKFGEEALQSVKEDLDDEPRIEHKDMLKKKLRRKIIEESSSSA
jgi:hypothetical protein